MTADSKKKLERAEVGTYRGIFEHDRLCLAAWVIGRCGLVAVIEIEGIAVTLFAESKP